MANTDLIFQEIEKIHLPGFFITAQFKREGECPPKELANFIRHKYAVIRSGATGRKFVFRSDQWVIVLTYFPTNQVVDERYALKNKTTLIKEKE